MKFLKSKLPAVIVLAGVLVLFAGILITGRLFAMNLDVYVAPTSIIKGVYSVDDGPWKEIDIQKPIDERFRKIVFKGHIIDNGYYLRELDISSKNVWYTLRTEDGELLYSNTYRIKDSEAWNAMLLESDDPEAVQETLDVFTQKMPMAMRMSHTPGYEHISFIPSEDLPEVGDKELIFTVENPYHSFYAFSDCMSFTLSSGNGVYLRVFQESFLQSVFFLLACFFGVFLFPAISFIFGRINYKYVTFGLLCFFWGFFMLLHNQSWILNNIIFDPVLCMMLERMALFFFFASLIIYCRANLNQHISRVICGAVMLVYFTAILAAVILHLTAVRDLAADVPYFNLLMGVIILVLAFLLIREALTDRSVLRYLLSWIPVIVTLFIDVLDQFLSMKGDDFFVFGFSLTLAAQIIQLGFDLQKQYRNALHYYQLQKELYEARVSIMTSQIRPHFMYNALTSIAMMCTIDPPTAQEATVTFAKYLRENMDSLKQNSPVPFSQELDHLKKYLYIEKLRFQNKLNIEYDITVTDFVLPLLSVQPLVENAVKHGVGMKKKGGTVKISTRETEDAFEVIISDDGVGFDPSETKADDGRSHVGMNNTRARLKEMCRGEIKIESKVGEGTVATIILPKEGQKNENTVS